MRSVTIMLILLLAGVQGAWADLRRSDNTVCSPKIHFKLPSGWETAYIVIGGAAHEFPAADANGWTTADLSDATVVGTNSDDAFYINGANDNTCQLGLCVLPTQFGVKVNDGRSVGFTCSTFEKGDKSWKDGNEVWIQDHPDVKKSGTTYMTFAKPNVKDFYIFLPQNETWKSATPVIREDGTDREMYNDSEHCGWYYRRYIDEDLPASVLIHRDDDEDLAEAIGVNGAWETNPSSPDPIPMSSMFILFDGSDALYFVADEDKVLDLTNSTAKGWETTRPDITGRCGYELAALIYDTDASLHGAFTCAPNWSQAIDGTEKVKYNACYNSSAKYNINSTGDAVVPCVGVTKGMVESTLSKDASGHKYMTLTTKGKTCFGSQADEAFKAMFTATAGVNEKYCFNMNFTQASDGKYEFESDTYQSPGAKVVGGFYPAETTPELTMMLSDRLAAAENKRKAEGPTFFCADDPNNQTSQTPLGLRTIHGTEGVPLSDLMCNGGGWEGGIDCEGLFAAGSEFSKDGTLTEAGEKLQTALTKSYGKKVTWGGDGWGWSCEYMGVPDNWPMYAQNSETLAGAATQNKTHRWVSSDGKDGDDGRVLTTSGRNQHFCFESHATFRFKKGLKFSFRGDDDIWVFINDKLAVDLGGTHLAAPGYVDLDKFMPDGEVGVSYPIDIFFCDRRTTMSNVHIKTNMFIEQTTGISYTGKQDKQAYATTHDNVYKLCYKESGGGSCAAAMGGSNGEKEFCDEEIKQAGLTVSYVFTQDQTATDPSKVYISETDFASNPVQANGGIDVSNSVRPIINEDKLKDFFPSGTYYLVVIIGNEKKPIKVTIKGNVGVANRDARTMDEAGNFSPVYTYTSQKMASTANDDGSVDPDQLVPLYIAAITDPCTTTDCTDPLTMQSADGESYTLETNLPTKVGFYKVANGVATPIDPSTARKIGETGIDTVWVTLPMNELETTEETVTVNVKGSSRKASILFFAPKLVFVTSETSTETVTGDPDTEVKLKGSAYSLYVLALNGDNTPCTTCNFSLSKSSQSSPGLNHLSGFELVNGRATIQISSSLVYDRATNGTATFVLVGPNMTLIKGSYGNMQFQEPPVPTPQFADIYDVHGQKPSSEMNVPSDYFSMEQEYLDGIGDSIVVYYHRNFHKDSLPDQIVVFWSADEKDSVLFTHEEIVAGAVCGSAAGLDDESQCLRRITLGGKNLSSSVKTGGTGTVKSWATYCPKFKDDGTCSAKPVTNEYAGVIYDRIAPIIISARASTESSGFAQLKIEFSEDVQKTDAGVAEGDNVFSFYINNGKNPRLEETNLPQATGFTIPQKMKQVQTLVYDLNQSSEFPQAGDYINFRGLAGMGLVMDQSEYAIAPNADSLRSAADASEYWNVATGYNMQAKHLPSPWVLISGDVNFYVVRLLPKTSSPLNPADLAKLPIIDVYTFDVNKEKEDFMEAVKNGTNGLDALNFTPHGWLVKSDLGALIESKEEYSQELSDKKDQVVFNYEVQYFTNLGSFVADKKGQIYCDDAKNQAVLGRTFFGGTNCVDNRRAFYITWNLKSNDNRLMGAGAYIAKIKTFVQLGKFGKFNKADKTEMWGVRHGDGTSYLVTKGQ